MSLYDHTTILAAAQVELREVLVRPELISFDLVLAAFDASSAQLCLVKNDAAFVRVLLWRTH